MMKMNWRTLQLISKKRINKRYHGLDCLLYLQKVKPKNQTMI